ncbi:MAG: hypothetical protein RLY86_4029 [Pseudomonadota bacterium]|jgi:sporulation-control protein
MLGKLLASIGIGAATIDTILDDPAPALGGRLTGTMRVRGGAVPQEISRIGAEIVTKVLVEVNDTKVAENRTVASADVGGAFTIQPGEMRDLPFALTLPLYTPVALGRSHAPAWLRTRLDIAMAIDPTDNDALSVRPAPVQVDAFNAMLGLGFQIYKTDVEHRPRWQGGTGFVQEFEFRPAGFGSNRRRFDEVELVFQPDGRGGLDLLIQVDRAARSLSGLLREATGMDETWHRLPLPGGLTGPGEPAIATALRRVLGI